MPGVVDEWNRERESLPKEMVIKQNKELRDMYIRMIEIRRKASAHKNEGPLYRLIRTKSRHFTFVMETLRLFVKYESANSYHR